MQSIGSMYSLLQTLGDGYRQGSLACCSPWCPKDSDKTERLNNNNLHSRQTLINHNTYTLLQPQNPSQQCSRYVLSRFCCVQLFATLWTLACRVPLSMGFSRQE